MVWVVEEHKPGDAVANKLAVGTRAGDRIRVLADKVVDVGVALGVVVDKERKLVADLDLDPDLTEVAPEPEPGSEFGR